MTGTVHIDITELLRNPIRTGIQRVERELIRYWPGPSRLCPVIAGRTGFQRLPEGILPALESAHALAGARRWAQGHAGKRVLVGLSGRGDKDMPTLAQTLTSTLERPAP